MFGWILNKRKRLIAVTNLNDMYAGTVNDVGIALGRREVVRTRKRLSKKIFVIDFDGDVLASQAKALSMEVTSVICNAEKGDEVLVRITSPGGAAHAYGYAASQLERLKTVNIPLTVSVDKIAASGGYLMACVADKIIAAPWAIIGSIGVVAEMPNFFEFLNNLGIDYKQYTAGKFKRTVSMLGPITEEGEKKFNEDLHGIYDMFRNHVATSRPILAKTIDSVATGEHWQGIKALELNLVDQIETSEEYILRNLMSAEIIKITYIGNRQTLSEKIGGRVAVAFASEFVKAMYNTFVNLSVNNKFLR